MTRITCAEGVDRLMDYLEGVVPADIRTVVEAHVSGCPRCVAFIASYCETPRIVRQATDVTLSQDGRQTLREFLVKLRST
jgi:anti-sigma factor RsiW